MRTCNRVVWSVFFALLANVASGAGVVSTFGVAEAPHDICALQSGAGDVVAGDLSALQGLMGLAGGEEPASGAMAAGPVHQATLDMPRVRAPRMAPPAMPAPVPALAPGGASRSTRPEVQESSLAPPRFPSALLPLGPHAPPFLA